MSAPAEAAAQAVLDAQRLRDALVLVDSPPGAGKTRLVVDAAAFSAVVLGERCAIVTLTNQQAFDVVRRLGQTHPGVPVALFARKGLDVPSGLPVTRSAQSLPPGIVVANAAKWAALPSAERPFDLMIVDEAYQLAFGDYRLVEGLAERALLVGDPGQLAPVTSCSTEGWEGRPYAPDRACPEALQPDRRIRLPVSRRLVENTVRLVQPVFYPRLPFSALGGTRRLRFDRAAAPDASFGLAMDRVHRGESLVGVALPKRVTGQDDPEMAREMVRLLDYLARQATQTETGRPPRRLTPEDLGVVCANASQVSALRARLPASLAGVLVETADRFQGLEREVILVHHPLSGRAALSDFLLDPRRLCVMLSRHRTACFVFARRGTSELLAEGATQADRPLGAPEDAAFQGSQAHRTVARYFELDAA